MMETQLVSGIRLQDSEESFDFPRPSNLGLTLDCRVAAVFTSHTNGVCMPTVDSCLKKCRLPVLLAPLGRRLLKHTPTFCSGDHQVVMVTTSFARWCFSLLSNAWKVHWHFFLAGGQKTVSSTYFFFLEICSIFIFGCFFVQGTTGIKDQVKV